MTPRAAALLALALVVVPAWAADRLHLTTGGIIVAESWRIEGDQLLIESETGTLSLPRSLLSRVEAGTGSTPTSGRVSTPDSSPAPAPSPMTHELRRTVAEATAALEAGDYETASRRFHAALQTAPDAGSLRAGYAVAEMALGRDPMALAVVLDGLARHGDDANLHEILGDLRDREERVDEALSAWKEAFRLAPTDRLRDKIEKAERELHAGSDYAFSAAAHFNLRYDEALDPDLAAEIADHLEDRFAELTGRLRHAPSQPITVILYPRRAFDDVTRAGQEVAGVYDGKIRVPLAGIRKLDDRARRLLTHELTHAFVHSKTRGHCPRWLHEGLAQFIEGRPLTRADLAAVGRALSEGDPASWHERAFSYPAALAFTRYLEQRRGFDALVWVLDRLGAGDDLDAALRSAYGDDYPRLATDWARSLAEGR